MMIVSLHFHQFCNDTERGNEVVQYSIIVALLSVKDASQIIVIEDGTVEVCVVVESPLLPCPITFTFEVIIATSNGTCIMK